MENFATSSFQNCTNNLLGKGGYGSVYRGCLADSQKHINFSLSSPLGGGRPGRVKRRNTKAASKKAAGGDADEEDDD